MTSETIGHQQRLDDAVLQQGGGARGLSEKLFARLFSGLVYPQIWEDPALDMEGLRLGAGKRVMTIASGGCNALSYLTANPERVVAVDLNRHHVMLGRLKVAAAQALPDHDAFFAFFGEGDRRETAALYRAYLRPALAPQERAYWDDHIGLFSRGLYKAGLLGRFLGVGHFAARLFGVRLRDMLDARDIEAQQEFFDAKVSPLFDRKLIRWISDRPASLFGLGIPPAQHDKLAAGRPMADVLRERMRKLSCDFPLSENYFAWQAYGRRYEGKAGSLPPYLGARNWETIRARAGRVSFENLNYVERLQREDGPSFDAYLLLDAQDWMNDDQLNALWTEITRTARPGARVLFRTADEPSLLPGRLDPALLERWRYEAEESADLTRRDRAAIYGGVHLYVFEG